MKWPFNKPVQFEVLERIAVLAWSGLESACRQGLSLVFFLLTMRFVSPADLGVFSLAVALTAIVGILIDEPIGESLVQLDDVTTLDWDTGYSVNLTIAVAGFVLSCLASLLLAITFNLLPLALAWSALSLSSVIGALGNIQKAYLSRSLNFRAIAKTALAAQSVAGMVMLGASILGLGWWALVLNVLIAAAITSGTYRRITPWKPVFRINRATVTARASYASYTAAVRSVYLLRDQPLLIVAGATVGLAPVGYLGLALRVGRTIGQLFEDVTSRPLLSLVSRQKNDLEQFGAVLKQIFFIIGAMALPGFLMLSEIGTPLLSTLLGKAWAPAGSLMPWVCTAIAGWLLLHIVAVSLRARGLGGVSVCLTAPPAVIDVAIFASAAFFGFPWALRLWALRSCLSIPIVLPLLSRRLGVGTLELFRIWCLPVLASVVMLASLRIVEAHLPTDPGITGVLMLVTAGAGAYLVTFAGVYRLVAIRSRLSNPAKVVWHNVVTSNCGRSGYDGRH